MGTNLAKYYLQSMRLARKTAKELKDANLTILAPAFYPSRLVSTINFLSSHDVKTILAGGGPGPDLVEKAPHYKLPFDTTGLPETKENIQKILSVIPKIQIPEKIGVLIYNSVTEGSNLWQQTIEEMFKTRVVCSNEQNLTSYFEEKTNLVDILKLAGLEDHIIPTEIIKEHKSPSELAMIYKSLKDNSGKVVIQSCGPDVSEIGGGHSTVIVKNFTDFCKICNETKTGFLKVAKFIDGVNSNVSICSGNTLPDKSSFGALKGQLLDSDNRYSKTTLHALLQRGKDNGLNKDNIISFVQPGTLKVVGDKNLTTCPTNGVGNQLNYSFPQKTLEEIYSIGTKLGSFMAMCGKVGLLGIDLIITKDGHIYINEINDRQQGPTETASINNEKHSLPGILRLGFLQNYANFNNPEVVEFFKQVNTHSKEIYNETTQIESPYYIKLAGEKVCKPSAITLSSGVYQVLHASDSSYHWNLSEKLPQDTPSIQDLSAPSFPVELTSVSLEQGEEITPDRQILRINGSGSQENSPFYIDENGESKLRENWVPIIQGLKREIYGENYNPNNQTPNSEGEASSDDPTMQ